MEPYTRRQPATMPRFEDSSIESPTSVYGSYWEDWLDCSSRWPQEPVLVGTYVLQHPTFGIYVELAHNDAVSSQFCRMKHLKCKNSRLSLRRTSGQIADSSSSRWPGHSYLWSLWSIWDSMYSRPHLQVSRWYRLSVLEVTARSDDWEMRLQVIRNGWLPRMIVRRDSSKPSFFASIQYLFFALYLRSR